VNLIIKNGRIVTPERIFEADIGIAGEKVVAVEGGIDAAGAEVIDAQGRYVLPGIIDAHVHLGVPILDTWSSDDFFTGTRAAACGGVTTVIDFTVQEKGQSLLEAIAVRHERAAGQCCVDYALHCNITDFSPQVLEEMGRVVDSGLTSFKVFMAYKRAGMMLDDAAVLAVLEKAAECNALLMVHAENGDIIDFLTDRLLREGKTPACYHPESRPALAEVEAVHRIIALAEIARAKVYIVHLTSREGLKLVEEAQQRGLPVLAETCPQYLLFTDDIYRRPRGHYYIASPPFRREADREALWRGLAAGSIQVIGTDHCPFTSLQKDSGNGDFHRTPNGLPGVETLLPLIFTHGVLESRIALQQLVKVLCENPAKVFGLYPTKGQIAVGSDADLVIVDPRRRRSLDSKKLHSNCDWSPYEGWRVAGVPEVTLLRGKVVARAGEFCGEDGWGKFVASQRR